MMKFTVRYRGTPPDSVYPDPAPEVEAVTLVTTVSDPPPVNVTVASVVAVTVWT